MHLVFKPDYAAFRSEKGVFTVATQLAAGHLALWSDPVLRDHALAKMQQRNPEWDFMSRTYFVLSLANMALRDPALRDQACDIIDCIIAHTLLLEKQNGQFHFLLGYAHGSWHFDPPRSIFVDGEIALMIGTRRIIQEKTDYIPLLAERVAVMTDYMNRSPVFSGESYPDECWLFCNTVALASIRIADVLDGTDHSVLISNWVHTAQDKLTDKETGLLIATYDLDGNPLPCGYTPEGSTIWMACHMLQVVDPILAENQYKLAHHYLARSFLGFGYSREWPEGLEGSMDVDSGPVIPVLGASVSASGLAILAAAAFDDRDYFVKLITALNCAGFPTVSNGQLTYYAGNTVGDAVLLYAMTEGPLWKEINSRRLSKNPKTK